MARAEGTNPAAAEALFDQGRAALAQNDLDTACARFRESDRLDPAVGTRFNLADCEEKRGRLASAWSLFRGVVAQLAEGDDRLPIAQKRLVALESRVPRLTMVLGAGAPSNTHVKEGETEYESASFGVALPLDPGMHHLIVSAPGYQARRMDVALEPGETAEVKVRPGPLVPLEEHVAPAAAPRSDNSRTLGYVLAGVGATGLVVGAVSGVLVLHQKSIYDANCDTQLKVCNQTGKDAGTTGRALGVVSVAGFAAGAVASAFGAYFILSSGRGRETALSGSITPEAALFSLRRTF
ncbi:MAG TPA: hypothetical protein VHV51_03170 [Polyangiaceae bacterium]|jgi:hypothetical protein|nr:hypothetical protein [Polyangiaceae bacterium]